MTTKTSKTYLSLIRGIVCVSMIPVYGSCRASLHHLCHSFLRHRLSVYLFGSDCFLMLSYLCTLFETILTLGKIADLLGSAVPFFLLPLVKCFTEGLGGRAA
jgi:hypothetical protein